MAMSSSLHNTISQYNKVVYYNVEKKSETIYEDYGSNYFERCTNL